MVGSCTAAVAAIAVFGYDLAVIVTLGTTTAVDIEAVITKDMTTAGTAAGGVLVECVELRGGCMLVVVVVVREHSLEWIVKG